MSDCETQPPEADCHLVFSVVEIGEVCDSQTQEPGYTSDKDLFDSTSSIDLENLEQHIDLENPVCC
jgi:hypothetical protein